MGTQSPRDAVARQWELLRSIPPNAPGRTAADLTGILCDAGYKVDKRTVERDLVALESMFLIMRSESKPFGWTKGRASDVFGITTTDALSLHLLERFLRPILPATTVKQLEPVFELASNKLASQKKTNAHSTWAEKVAVVDAGLPVLPAPIDQCALESIQSALLAEEQVSMDYVRADGVLKTAQTLNPLGLVQSGAITYLIATTSSRENPRSYPLHRVRGARRLHQAAIIPNGFALKGFIADGGLQFGANRTIQLVAWVSPMLAGQLRDTRLSEDQQLEPVDDGCILRASVTYSWRLRWWVLSKSGDIEVRAPEDLRSEVGDLLRVAAQRYSPDMPTC